MFFPRLIPASLSVLMHPTSFIIDSKVGKNRELTTGGKGGKKK